MLLWLFHLDISFMKNEMEDGYRDGIVDKV